MSESTDASQTGRMGRRGEARPARSADRRTRDGLVDAIAERAVDAHVSDAEFERVVDRAIERLATDIGDVADRVAAAVADRIRAEMSRILADTDALIRRVLDPIDHTSPLVRRVAEAVCARLEQDIRDLALGTLRDPDRAADVIADGIRAYDPAVTEVVDRVRDRVRPEPVQVYGITTRAAWAARDAARHDGPDAFRTVESGPLVALVGTDDGGPDAFRAWMRRQARILGHVVRHVTVVPVAFGTVTASDRAVRDLLDARRSAWLELLRRFGGCVEWTVRVAAITDDEPDDSAIVTMLEALEPHAEGSAARTHGANEPATIVSRAYLVRRDRSEAFRSTLGRLARDGRPHGLVYELGGPWPPYHFMPDA